MGKFEGGGPRYKGRDGPGGHKSYKASHGHEGHEGHDGHRGKKHYDRPFDNNPDRRAQTAGVHIDRISYGKALFKKKQQQKRDAQIHEKASMLRNYAKLCKREGIISDRVHIGPKEERDDNSNKASPARKPKKPSNDENDRKISLQQEYAMALEKKNQDSQVAQTEVRDNEEMKALREKKRREESKKRMQKTKKGQPILGNQVKSLLSKLQAN
jgi:hypothetical protein